MYEGNNRRDIYWTADSFIRSNSGLVWFYLEQVTL